MLEGGKLLLHTHRVSSQFMLAPSLFACLIAPLILPRTVSPTWFYLCHHIRLSGGKSLLMTQRLLALCFGLPVNAGHASGISPHKPSLSVYNNCCVLLLSTRISKRNTTSLCRFTQWHCWAIVLKGTVSCRTGQCFYCHRTMCVEKLTLLTNWSSITFLLYYFLSYSLEERFPTSTVPSFICSRATSRHVLSAAL